MSSELRPEAVREAVSHDGYVKLVSDGKSGRSTFLLMPDGQPIPGIGRIEWTCDGNRRIVRDISKNMALERAHRPISGASFLMLRPKQR